jgi:hypothetical protein
MLREYARYYNSARTHRSLDQDAPISRSVQQIGRIVSQLAVCNTYDLGFRHAQGANLVIVYRPISTPEWSDPCFAIRNAQSYGGAGAATEANGGISRD